MQTALPRAVVARLLLAALSTMPACGSGKSPVEKCDDLIADTCADAFGLRCGTPGVAN